MQINEKHDNLPMDDLRAWGRNMDISDKRIKEVTENIVGFVRDWTKYAEFAGVSVQAVESIRNSHKCSAE